MIVGLLAYVEGGLENTQFIENLVRRMQNFTNTQDRGGSTHLDGDNAHDSRAGLVLADLDRASDAELPRARAYVFVIGHEDLFLRERMKKAREASPEAPIYVVRFNQVPCAIHDVSHSCISVRDLDREYDGRQGRLAGILRILRGSSQNIKGYDILFQKLEADLLGLNYYLPPVIIDVWRKSK